MGETPDQLPPQLSSSVAINPPIDLGFCVERFTTGPASFYNWHVVKSLYRQICRSSRLIEQRLMYSRECRAGNGNSTVCTRRTSGALIQLTNSTPTPVRAESSQMWRIPSLLIASRDDPLVPVELFEQLELPDSITLCLADHGGHMGFIGQLGQDPDRRWMDWRIVDWITAHQHLPQAAAA